MDSINRETSPLLSDHRRRSSPTTSQDEHPQRRTVTFDPAIRSSISNETTTSRDFLKPFHPSQVSGTGQPVFAALNSKIRRRHSQGTYNAVASASSPAPPKIGPQRTTKNTQKLKLLPNPVTGEENELVEDEIPSEVYSQITRIKEPTARKHAARLGKADRDRVPRVTAYCTASSYRIDGVIRFLKSRTDTRGSNPKLFDECVYSPYNYDHDEKKRFISHGKNGREVSNIRKIHGPEERRSSDSEIQIEDRKSEEQELTLDIPDIHQDPSSTSAGSSAASAFPHAIAPISTPDDNHNGSDLDTSIHTPEIFLFDYGTVVIWGMTPAQETRFLHEVSKFASAVLSPEDTQVENFNFYYTRDYQARIYNDFISLQDPHNYMTKLAISHALSQSVKTSLFEDLVSETITKTSPLPAQIAETGSVNLTRRQINMQIGELFILRINIHLQGSVLDSPELMWAEPQLEPVYQAVRSYLEMDQRVGLLTERLEVIADLLAVLKDQLSHRHGEYLEWIVIILIATEIVVAGINIIVDLYAGVD
ncbi:sporulation protein RMD1 [Paracoccidioides lutzii Pb01]|uniref:Sporulation protein RMD1 n=1 Tax=Paracoccidioides lutzii (strain ATCC MYA-826 / Pb01) TaxID=502779 RepID=C1GNM4_PARBA|nr:sporulation protein RMD1 [Paracoccidioides lutzii Pb01]EEH35796.1 sporulation protein RMD1 [Paracoccidioides lutzii Pb01]